MKGVVLLDRDVNQQGVDRTGSLGDSALWPAEIGSQQTGPVKGVVFSVRSLTCYRLLLRVAADLGQATPRNPLLAAPNGRAVEGCDEVSVEVL